MEDKASLSDAFQNFTAASKSLEQIYEKLQDRVQYLAGELEKKNRQLETALYETQEVKDFLKEILESLREAIIVLDTAGNIAMFNKAAERIFGVELDEVKGKPFSCLDAKIEGKEADTVLQVKDRRINVFLSRSNVLDTGGMVRGEVILLQDITRLKELEAHQERNKRLIAMGEMAATIVHEIRSPLCSIELFASMLEKEMAGTGQEELARGISTGIRSLNNILTNMLIFARPEKLTLKPLDLDEVVDEALLMLRPLISSRGITLDRSSEPEGDIVTIKGDDSLLKQVFMNIVINAVQVSRDGASLAVEVQVEDSRAVVRIADEGEGIEKENLERIFDPFFTTREKGTGLGLAIAARIVQAHEGAINVKSKVGAGTTFELFFPLLRPLADTGNG